MIKKNTFKSLCFDIDGIICYNVKDRNYKKAKPIKKNIKYINKLYKNGFKITLFTARYMGRCSNNRSLAENKIKKLTISQLNSWNVKYHELFFGKPSFDLLIDDKAIFFEKNWINYLEKKLL